MADKPRNYEEEYSNIMNALAEFTFEMSDEEVEAEIREDDDDPEGSGGQVKKIRHEAIKAHQQRHLLEAQQQYAERIAAMKEKKYDLPESPEERRTLLMAFLSNRPEIGSAVLTAQHRDFKDLTDADVESYLKQFHELGAMDATAKTGEEK
jgi:hypothetical protein